MTDFLTSLIRTWVPVGIGTGAAWVARKTGFVIDEDTQAQAVGAVTGLAIGAYYSAVRWLETKNPSWGWLLGVKRQPTYS